MLGLKPKYIKFIYNEHFLKEGSCASQTWIPPKSY